MSCLHLKTGRLRPFFFGLFWAGGGFQNMWYIIVCPSLRPISLRGNLPHHRPYERKRTLECSSKQGDRMLVSKYYPAVDHSYPRNEVIPQYDPPQKHDRPVINGFREITPKTDRRPNGRGDLARRRSAISCSFYGAVGYLLAARS
jgi:hypothetical protein